MTPLARPGAILAFALTTFCLRGADPASSWEKAFTNPPESTKPWVYWYWISDHISKEGITHDLEAMARQGIAEAEIGNVDVTPEARGTVKALTPEWWDLVEHAVREGNRVGVRVGFFNAPGWSQSGGPWVKPGQSMRFLTASETRVTGPKTFEGDLPAPTASFQPVAVLAYPAPAGDTDKITKHQPRVTSKVPGAARAFDGDPGTAFLAPTTAPGGAQPFEIDLEVASPFTARSLVMHPAPNPFRVECELQARQPDGDYRSIRTFEVDRRNPGPNLGPMPWGPVAVAVPDTAATNFRLIFRRAEGTVGFTEIELIAGARLERYVEKQLGKMFQEPLPLWGQYLWPTPAEPGDAAAVVPVDRIRNLTASVDAKGHLKWDVPAGDWILARVGMTPTGVTNGPASPEATGLEVDKMNRAAVRAHFDAYAGKLIARLPDLDPAKAGHIVADSYEMGSQNWTDGLEEIFRRRYGYDPLPWLPVLSGRLVGSADQSERFLWDLRRLVADRISTEYVGGLRDLAHEHARKLWLENYGHWGFPGEFLSYGANSDRVGGEFWTSGDLGSIELRAASSAAHTNGKPFVSAEAFTSGGPLWQLDPWALKKRQDWSWTEGVNHFVLHVYIHQPYDDRRPGVNAPFGTEFNRLNPWFPFAHGWIDSFRRAFGLLQHGRPKADVLYFIGEDAPKMTGTREPVLPRGYDFDYINAEVLEKNLTVKDGRFELPGGASYGLLVLPPQSRMRPAVLRRLERLVADGGAVFGPAPTRSPSLQDFPKADDEVRNLATKLWAGLDGKSTGMAAHGKGRIFTGPDLQPALDALGVAPDVMGLPAEKKALWTHRGDAEGDVYFLSNQTDEPLDLQPAFRVTGRQPEWWDYVSGETRLLPAFEQSATHTTVPLRLAPRQAGFVVFRSPTTAATGEGENFPASKSWKAVDGAWSVKFGERAPVMLEALVDWSKSGDVAIRNFSGIATYSKTVPLPRPPASGKVWLDLGGVHGVASVRLNGRDLGVLWANPRRVDVTAVVKEGENTLEIQIANTWANELIGQMALPKDLRKTWTSIDTIKADTPLAPSGMVGPVAFEREE